MARAAIEWLYFQAANSLPMWLSRYHWWWTFIGNARGYFEAREAFPGERRWPWTQPNKSVG